MSMEIHWQIRFKSLRVGTDYTLNIYDSDYSGSPIVLKGGAKPFTTQESDNDEMFNPLRTQSGYIRIVDDGKDATGNSWNWKTLLPATDTDRPLTLTDGSNNVVWQGYMQAQNFGGTLYGNPQERSFPVQCPLSALSASDVNSTNRELRNFAFIIKQAFDNLTGLTFGRFVFQGGAKARDMLLKLVDWQNMIMSSDDGLSGKYDNMRVIEDVCRFWGWSVRAFGADILFTCADDNTVMPNALVLTPTELETMAGGTSAGTTDEQFLTNVALSGNIFANTSQDDFIVRGINKAMVTTDGNPAEKEIIGFAPASVEKEMKGRTSYNEQDGSTFVYYTGDLLSFASHYVEGTCREGYASFNIADIRAGNMVNSGDSGDVIRIKKSFTSTSAEAYASLKTVFHHSFYDANSSTQFFNTGGLSLKGKIYQKATQLEDHDSHQEQIGNKVMYMRIGIGIDRAHAKWYTGTGWSSTVTALTVAVGNTDDQLYIKATNSGGHQSTSYQSWIPTHEQNLFGIVFIEFLGSNDIPEINGERSFDIHDFSLEFVRSTTVMETSENISTTKFGNFGGARKYRVIERAGSREYVAKNQNKIRNDWNSDMIYASDNDMEFGYGVVMNTDGSQMGQQTYGSDMKWPEQHMADRVALYWERSRRKLSLNLRKDHAPAVSPRNTISIDGTTGYPISIGHEWRDDITQITILEL